VQNPILALNRGRHFSRVYESDSRYDIAKDRFKTYNDLRAMIWKSMAVYGGGSVEVMTPSEVSYMEYEQA
jgi:hypothetical protein